jgi:hypothetical protein
VTAEAARASADTDATEQRWACASVETFRSAAEAIGPSADTASHVADRSATRGEASRMNDDPFIEADDTIRSTAHRVGSSCRGVCTNAH